MSDGPVGLGHCLMRVNQEDLFERQPLVDREAELTLVADCRIDNREELADAFGLSAADIRDMPDSAFVLRAYKKWGEDCAEHLLGDFAFAIWDGRRRKLVLGRDHMGQRTSIYHHGKDFFAFATEIKALWALPDVPRRSGRMRGWSGFILENRTAPPDGSYAFRLSAAAIPGGAAFGRDRPTISSRRYWEPHAGPGDGARRGLLRRELSPSSPRPWPAGAPADRAAGTAAERRLDSAAIAGLAGPALTAKGRKLITVSSVLPADYQRTAFMHARPGSSCAGATCRTSMCAT